MKKILGIIAISALGLMGSAFAWSSTEFSNETAAWLHGNGLTKYETKTAFQPNGHFTREQAAKFFAAFATHFVRDNKTLIPESQCQFSDINQADSTLRESIVASCQLGIFKGFQGKFAPKANITLAEATAVLIRITHGMMNETDRNNWYDRYIFKAAQFNIIPNINHKNFIQADYMIPSSEANSIVTRGTIGLMLYRAPRQYVNTEYGFSFYYPFNGVYTVTDGSYVKIENNQNNTNYSEQPGNYTIESNVVVGKDCTTITEEINGPKNFSNEISAGLFYADFDTPTYKVLFCRNIGNNAATITVDGKGKEDDLVRDSFKIH